MHERRTMPERTRSRNAEVTRPRQQGASPFQCKPVWCVARPAVEVVGLMRFSQAWSRNVIPNAVRDLAPAVLEAAGGCVADRVERSTRHPVPHAALSRPAQTGSLAPVTPPCLRGGPCHAGVPRVAGRRRMTSSRSSGGYAATRSAPRSPPPRPCGRGGKGRACPLVSPPSRGLSRPGLRGHRRAPPQLALKRRCAPDVRGCRRGLDAYTSGRSV
jgi:hypothetical protein